MSWEGEEMSILKTSSSYGSCLNSNRARSWFEELVCPHAAIFHEQTALQLRPCKLPLRWQCDMGNYFNYKRKQNGIQIFQNLYLTLAQSRQCYFSFSLIMWVEKKKRTKRARTRVLYKSMLKWRWEHGQLTVLWPWTTGQEGLWWSCKYMDTEEEEAQQVLQVL